MVKPLTPSEASIVRHIANNLPPAELRRYLAHRQGEGLRPATIDEINLCQSLHDKGWVTPRPEIFNAAPVYLTLAAWRRFALDEWFEIEETAARDKVAGTFGEW